MRSTYRGDHADAGKPTHQAIWLGDIPVAVVGSNSPIGTAASSNQTLNYIEADHLNTPRVVIDPDRNVAIWSWDIHGEAFGASQPNEDPDGDGKPFTLDLRFPGQRYDSATGLYQNDHRDYDPQTGRYLQSDPIGLNGGASGHEHSGDIPTTAAIPPYSAAFPARHSGRPTQTPPSPYAQTGSIPRLSGTPPTRSRSSLASGDGAASEERSIGLQRWDFSPTAVHAQPACRTFRRAVDPFRDTRRRTDAM